MTRIGRWWAGMNNWLQRWLLRLVLVGVVLDLTVSGLAIGIAVNTAQLGDVTRCWVRVLDQAVHTNHPTPASRTHLQAEANICAHLKVP